MDQGLFVVGTAQTQNKKSLSPKSLLSLSSLFLTNLNSGQHMALPLCSIFPLFPGFCSEKREVVCLRSSVSLRAGHDGNLLQSIKQNVWVGAQSGRGEWLE